MIRTYFIEKNYALLLRTHPWKDIVKNVWQEYHNSMGQQRYRNESERYQTYIHTQVGKGLSPILVDSYHGATGILLRNMKHEKIQQINDTWYEHIQECGIQCQIAFFFARQSFPNEIYTFQEYPFKLLGHIEI